MTSAQASSGAMGSSSSRLPTWTNSRRRGCRFKTPTALLGHEQARTHDHVIVNNGFSQMGKSALIARDGWQVVQTGRKKGEGWISNVLKDDEERENLEQKFPESAEELKAFLERELGSPRPDLVEGE